jgi:prephenate dehydratase
VARYAFLGPQGTFTEVALEGITAIDDLRIPYANVTATLDAVRDGEVDFALVPIENSVEGVVARTLDELAIGDPLVIVAETTIPVNFALAVNGAKPKDEITQIATHPHAESQCRKYIAKNYPHAEIIPMPSTAAAAEAVSRGEYHAAITSASAASRYSLLVVEDEVGDAKGAETRFVLVSRPGRIPEPSGYDRTSLVAFIGADHAGALLEVLTEFSVRGVNLTFIQSRPTGAGLGDYHFIIDAEGHINDERVGEALMGLRRICADVRFLGSYPRADKVAPTTNRNAHDENFVEASEWLTNVRSGKKI